MNESLRESTVGRTFASCTVIRGDLVIPVSRTRGRLRVRFNSLVKLLTDRGCTIEFANAETASLFEVNGGFGYRHCGAILKVTLIPRACLIVGYVLLSDPCWTRFNELASRHSASPDLWRAVGFWPGAGGGRTRDIADIERPSPMTGDSPPTSPF